MSRIDFVRSENRFAARKNFFEELKRWGKLLGFLPPKGASLNLSYRYALGYVVMREGVDLSLFSETDLLNVVSWDFQNLPVEIRGSGELPALGGIHAPVYQYRSTAIFSFYLQSGELAEKAESRRWPMILKPDHFQDMSFLEEVALKLEGVNHLLIQKHGVLSFGCTSDDAGVKLLELLKS